MIQQLRFKAFVIAAALLLASGCTQERALALKAGADAFSTKATAAINALVELNLRANLGKVEEEEVLVQRTREDLLKTQREAPKEIGTVINTAFQWLYERETIRHTDYAKYDDLKLAYAQFAAAFSRLPEGSLFAAKEVSCSAALGARLISYMVGAGRALAANPVPLIYETAQSQNALKKSVAESIKTRNEQPFDAVVRSHVAILKEQQRSNADVVAKLTEAAEAGTAVLAMIDHYEDVSVADLMMGFRQALVVRESTTGLSSKTQLARLDNVMEKLNSKPALAVALKMPLDQAPAQCN